MEFYEYFKGERIWAKIVSIPNGMEFYFFLAPLLLCRLGFQFPTGWNSTLSAVFRKLEIALFQFPTGWNSTLIFVAMNIILASFNSQRDGILHCFCFIFAVTHNSFNSQRDGILHRGWFFLQYTPRCFNSQRDGILPSDAYIGRARMKFQFPTGWNSTYLDRAKKTMTVCGFNSQRDGILLNSHFWIIPKICCFNSQRDGILPFPARTKT